MDPAGAFTGYTIQFQHQGVQYGVAAFFSGTEWEYTNAFIDIESGEMTGFEPTTGSFTPGSPALLTILFDKGLFPHGDAADNQLVAFQGGTADFKSGAPWFFAPVPVPPPNGGYTVCDVAEGTGTYTFQVGGHSAHASPANGTAPAAAGSGAANNATAPSGAPVERAAAPSAEGSAPATEKRSPGAGTLGAILAGAVAAASLGRRRHP